MRDPIESDHERVKFVLMQFVAPWKLGVNPEDLDVMAHCVLAHALGSARDWDSLGGLVQEEIRRHGEAGESLAQWYRERAEERAAEARDRGETP